MLKFFRINEYKVLAFRILLAYFFYFIARTLFYLYNSDFLKVDNFFDFLSLCYYGLAFDTTAILYVNLLFIVFSILPFWKNTTIGYQKFLFYLYFATNIFAYSFNFIDFIYYKYSLTRTTTAALEVVKHETNKSTLFLSFLVDYWHVFVLLILCTVLWIYLYKKVNVRNLVCIKLVPYFVFSIVSLLLIATLIIGGIRGGDFQKSTRPINLVDAGKHVKKINHSDIVLNTPFAIIRTLFSNSFRKPDFLDVNEVIIAEKIQPIKQYANNSPTKPNVVVFILESYSREYIGAFNSILKVK
ncbi:MAG: LTA synthase family protein, partial [Flavobacterium sp.]|nr:LTA synthase family protein [Flavobacterium sp.]